MKPCVVFFLENKMLFWMKRKKRSSWVLGVLMSAFVFNVQADMRAGDISIVEKGGQTYVYPPAATRDCDSIRIGYQPVSATPASSNSFFGENTQGQRFLVTATSQQKKCSENEGVEAVLKRHGIKYQKEGGRIRALDFEALSEGVLQAVLDDINKNAGRVHYIVDSIGNFNEHTSADYYQEAPEIGYAGQDVGFDLFVPTNFGLRGYYISADGQIVSEGGAYNTAFYSVATTDDGETLFISAPGVRTIYRYEKDSGRIDPFVEGYSVTHMRVLDGKLLFFGYQNPEDWTKAALFEAQLDTGSLTQLTEAIFSDVRGMAVKGDRMYVSNGNNNNIVVLDRNNLSKLYDWEGFSWPNGLGVSSTGTLLVADEHAGVIRELDVDSGEELRVLGFGVLNSPGEVQEILKGPYQGKWMVADTDSDRLIIFDPDAQVIVQSVTHLRGPLDFAMIYE
ncbi:hypothetical protein FMZ60_00565 [Alcaligenaceae bacterium SJ-26]|nr:hypothetical protein FMZ60_00565 [Alcaligenaceae bacterium SJ-26]